MVPPQELAIHAPLPTRAATTLSWIFAVDRTANELEPVPHGNTLPTTVPWYVAPARLRVVLNACPLMLPESRTSHGPVTQAGLASHDSSQFLWPVREEAPRTIFRWTVHAPCSRAAASGGMEVRTASAADRAERLPPRTAATRYWYALAGARPVTRYDVTVPRTEPITLPSCRIWYLSGGGPVAGPAQWNATELVVEVPAASPVGRSSGGLRHGAQSSRPTIRPSAATTAITATRKARLRRAGAGAAVMGAAPAGAAVASAAVTGAAGAVARVASAGNGGGDSSGSVAVTPLSATAAVQPVPSQ